MLYWRLATASARNPRCAWRPCERAKLYHVLHLRDLSEKNEGIHVLVDGQLTEWRLLRDGTLSPPLLGWAAHARTAAQSSVAAHLLQSFWLLSEHWACAAELSKPVFLNTTFCE